MENVISLDDLFPKRLFQVPDYQRGYSWEHQQVQEFLEDLELLSDGRCHYTGTVVLHEPVSANRLMDKEGNSYIPVDVVDGQQRLTTIVLLLDGIRRSLAGLSEDVQPLSQGIRKNYVSADGINGAPLFKLSLNADTDHFFRNGILSDQPSVEGPKITSERRLAEAKQQIAKYIADNMPVPIPEAEQWLQTLYTKLTTRLRFTLYEVEDQAEVGVIFESMNDRGKPLTNLEKVKNFLLHASTLDPYNDLAEAVNGAWAEILSQLMAADLIQSTDEDRLLSAHWLTHYDPRSRQWDGSKSVKGRFSLRSYKDRQEDLLRHLHCYTEGLRASSISFCDAYQPHRPDAFESFKVQPKVRLQVVEWSAKLRRTGYLVTFLPLLMAVRHRFPDDPDKYLRVLKLCETFAFRVYRWSEFRSNAGQAKLFRLGYELATNNRTYDSAVENFRDTLADWCGHDDFQFEDTSEDPINWYRWGGLRYFLYEYELSLTSGKGVSPLVTWDEVRDSALRDTIEHVLPQSISEQPYWEYRFSNQDHQLYLHDLGNLTLTKNNPALGNKSFPKKKGDRRRATSV